MDVAQSKGARRQRGRQAPQNSTGIGWSSTKWQQHINGRKVTVNNFFAAAEQQNATVDEIAASLPQAAAPV
jgi:hypothetical protein